MQFILDLMNCHIPKIALENPVGSISTAIGPPTQIVQPWWFGDEAQKTTCLWLKNLPKLLPTKIVGKGEMHTLPSGKLIPKWYSNANQIERSRTFPGFAEAMADQWGGKYKPPRGFNIIMPKKIKKEWEP